MSRRIRRLRRSEGSRPTTAYLRGTLAPGARAFAACGIVIPVTCAPPSKRGGLALRRDALYVEEKPRDPLPADAPDGGFYRFPRMAGLDGWSMEEQLRSVGSERIEAALAADRRAASRSVASSGETADRTMLGVELMDVIHATETALRIEFEDHELEGLRRAVIEKNAARGYYDEGVAG